MMATLLITYLYSSNTTTKYLVFHNKDTPIKLGFSIVKFSYLTPISVSLLNLCLEQYTETLSIFYISDLYIRLVVTL